MQSVGRKNRIDCHLIVENRIESRDPSAENKTVTGTTFMRFRGPGA
jgi:hypothetical protein